MTKLEFLALCGEHNIELLNKDGASPVVELLDVVIIEVTNSTGAFVKFHFNMMDHCSVISVA